MIRDTEDNAARTAGRKPFGETGTRGYNDNLFDHVMYHRGVCWKHRPVSVGQRGTGESAAVQLAHEE